MPGANDGLSLGAHAGRQAERRGNDVAVRATENTRAAMRPVHI